MAMIELNPLRYFISAFETRTFSQAARENGVSQPTVSAAIQRLEDRLGAALFQRSKSGLAPTPLAIRLYHDSLKSVAHLATLEERLQDKPQQVVRVHCAADMLLHKITPGLNSLRRLTANLVFSFTDDPLGCDIAYLTDTCVPDMHDFMLLEEEPFGVALWHLHPFAALPGLCLTDMRDQPLIHRPYCPNADRVDLGLIHTSAVARATNDPQLLDLVAAGLGIAFVPRSHCENRNDIVWLPLLDAKAGTRRVGISHRKSVFAAGLAEKLVNSIGQ